ncbi:hypothetical protein [uncultured Mediterranean phage uvMED]|nr:hypothetical protein [uncultured Mediterranean phage uvMED]
MQGGLNGQIYWSTSIHDTTIEQYANIERTNNYNFLIRGYQGGDAKVNADLEAIFLSIKQEYQESIFSEFTVNISRMGKVINFDNERRVINACLELYKSTMITFVSLKVKDEFNSFFSSKRIPIKKSKEHQIKEIEKKIKSLNNKINKSIGLLGQEKENKKISIDEHIVSTGLAFEPAIQIDDKTTLSRYIVYIKKASDRIKYIKEQQVKHRKNGK